MQHHHRPHHGGRHELGQNFLADPELIKTIQRLVATQTRGPIIELGAGDGALTRPLARLGRPVTALEIDSRRIRRLTRILGDSADVVCADVLRFRFPATPHTIVGNIPFHLTTAILRSLLPERGWTSAVLIVQWEVARRRAGVGGASLLTASWWPWYEFRLVRRIPATSFRPVPSIDAGLMTIHRRPLPLVDDRSGYQAFVKQVFQSRGRGLADMVQRSGRIREADLHAWIRRNRIPARALPKDLSADDWAQLWNLAQPAKTGTSPAAARRRE